MARSRPVAASQTLSVRSALAETMKEPLGLTAQALTQWVWPARVRLAVQGPRKGLQGRPALSGGQGVRMLGSHGRNLLLVSALSFASLTLPKAGDLKTSLG